METAALNAPCDAAVRDRAAEARALLAMLPGTWVYEGDAVGADGVREPVSGLETIRPVEGEWLLMESVPHAPGRAEPTTLTALCFDGERGHYVGSRFDSDSPSVWLVRGRFYAGSAALTLETEVGDEGTRPVRREVIEFVGPDHRRVTVYEGAGSGWRKRWMAEYHRTKW